jgi:hypothetical protein
MAIDIEGYVAGFVAATLREHLYRLLRDSYLNRSVSVIL